jgi:hypothetical protein
VQRGKRNHRPRNRDREKRRLPRSESGLAGSAVAGQIPTAAAAVRSGSAGSIMSLPVRCSAPHAAVASRCRSTPLSAAPLCSSLRRSTRRRPLAARRWQRGDGISPRRLGFERRRQAEGGGFAYPPDQVARVRAAAGGGGRSDADRGRHGLEKRMGKKKLWPNRDIWLSVTYVWTLSQIQRRSTL